MSKSKRGHVRFNAQLCLRTATPFGVVDAVIKSGLNDKSSRVRWKAAETAYALRRKKLIPELTAAMNRETHEQTRSSIEFSLRLLRDGYLIERQEDGRYYVTVSFPREIGSRFVSAKEMKARGVKAVVNSYRRDYQRRFAK